MWHTSACACAARAACSAKTNEYRWAARGAMNAARARPMRAGGVWPMAVQRCPEPHRYYYDARADGLPAPPVAPSACGCGRTGRGQTALLARVGTLAQAWGPREPRCPLSPALRTPRAPPREPQCTLSLALRTTRLNTLTGTAVHTVTGPPRRVSLRARGGPRGVTVRV